MKIDWSTVAEIIIAGVVLIAIYSLFGGWIMKHGQAITGEHPAVA